MPEPSVFIEKNPDKTAFMEMRVRKAMERDKIVILKQRFINYYEISQYLKDAVRISEDASFFQHNGFDLHEINQSLWVNLKKGRIIRGGSTITQQLVKNLYLTESKTFWRKLKEALITVKIENQLPKIRIYELYLNYIELGYGIFGVEAASKIYFRKSSADLNLFEAVRLAAIIPSPLLITPNMRSSVLEKRSKNILEKLFRYNKITEEEYLVTKRRLENFFHPYNSEEKLKRSNDEQ